MFSDLLRIFGNGCAGSRPSGDSTGMISSRKYARNQSLCAGFQVSRPSTRTPAPLSAGRMTVFQQSYCAATSSAARSWIRVNTVAGASPSEVGMPSSCA